MYTQIQAIYQDSCMESHMYKHKVKRENLKVEVEDKLKGYNWKSETVQPLITQKM